MTAEQALYILEKVKKLHSHMDVAKLYTYTKRDGQIDRFDSNRVLNWITALEQKRYGRYNWVGVMWMANQVWLQVKP